MTKKHNKPTLSQIMFILSAVTVIYWLVALNTNVYYYAVTGAIFEMTSIIFMASIYILPLLLIALIFRLKKRTPKLHFISLAILLIMLTAFFTIYQ